MLSPSLTNTTGVLDASMRHWGCALWYYCIPAGAERPNDGCL